jgi:hypothetical protein
MDCETVLAIPRTRQLMPPGIKGSPPTEDVLSALFDTMKESGKTYQELLIASTQGITGDAEATVHVNRFLRNRGDMLNQVCWTRHLMNHDFLHAFETTIPMDRVTMWTEIRLADLRCDYWMCVLEEGGTKQAMDKMKRRWEGLDTLRRFVSPILFSMLHVLQQFDALALEITEYEVVPDTEIDVLRAAQIAFDVVDERCMICLQEFAGSEEPMELLTCHHIVGRRCLEEWVPSSPFPVTTEPPC